MLRGLSIWVLLAVSIFTFGNGENFEENSISQDDRRAGNPDELKATELQTSSSSFRSRFYLPLNYEDQSIDSPGFFGQYLPPYYETGNHHGGYGFASDPGQGHHTFRSPTSHGSSYGSLALKGLLIPLAGIALLGAAAALSTNPVLLQLGVLSGRRKRSISEVYPVNLSSKRDYIS